MAILIADLEAQLHAARAARDRLVAEAARARAELGPGTRAGDTDRAMGPRRTGELPERVFAASILAEQCAVAKLEAELVEPREDYDAAIRQCARAKAAGERARPGWERARDRLVRASGRIGRLELERGQHTRELAALLARADTGGRRHPAGVWGVEVPAATGAAEVAPCRHPTVEGRGVLHQGMHSSGWACLNCDRGAPGESHHRSGCRADFCGAAPEWDEGPGWPLPADPERSRFAAGAGRKA